MQSADLNSVSVAAGADPDSGSTKKVPVRAEFSTGGILPAVLRPQAQTLRPYQEDCVQAIDAAWQRGETPLAWLATGGGKTTILSEVLYRQINPDYQRALVFAHTKEIVEQIAERVTRQFGEALRPYYGPRFVSGVGIVRGEMDLPDARIVIATRQSLHPKRLERVLQTGPFDVVLIDESHHVAPDNSYLDIVKVLREANPAVKIAGLTATPKRTDKKGLGILFSGICYRWTILDGINGGYLSPATRIKVRTGVNTTGVKSTAGDYNERELISVLDASNWTALALSAFREYAEQRQTLAFFPKVDMSRAFVEQLRADGIAAEHIDANTQRDQRDQILRDYQRGLVRVVSNMGVLTEGFDAPQTGAILMGRPTRSETLFTQIIGRGLRLYPGKLDCRIIDMTVVDTKVLEIGTVLGQMADCAKCGMQFFAGLKRCPGCGEAVVAELINTKACPRCDAQIPRAAKVCPECGYEIRRIIFDEDEFKEHGTGLHAEIAQLFHTMSAAWQPDEAGWFSVGVGFDGSALVIAPPTYGGNAARLHERLQRGYRLLPGFVDEDQDDLIEQMDMLRRELARIDSFSLYYVPPMRVDPSSKRDLPDSQQPGVQYIKANADLASLMQEGDSTARQYGGVAADKDARWRRDLASEGQRAYLKRLGVRKLPDDLTKGEAAQKISHIKAMKRVKAAIAADCLEEPGE